MVGEVAGRTNLIKTGRDERYMSLYLGRISPDGLDWPSKLTLDEEAETREEMIRSLRYRNEREKLCDFPPPMITLWTKILGDWPSPTSGGCRFLLEAREWFFSQMDFLAKAKYSWSKGRRLEVPGVMDKEYSRFGLDPDELEKQGWRDPVERIRWMERPKGLKIPLLSKVKSKEIGD